MLENAKKGEEIGGGGGGRVSFGVTHVLFPRTDFPLEQKRLSACFRRSAHTFLFDIRDWVVWKSVFPEYLWHLHLYAKTRTLFFLKKNKTLKIMCQT